jgi:hypothetical protein
MAFSELESKRYEKAAKAFIDSRRPPPEIRPQLDLAFRIRGQSIEIFEIRPAWNDPSEKMENSVAKATYVRRKDVWRIFWQRADLAWHRYEPVPEVERVEEFFETVDADGYCCFFG